MPFPLLFLSVSLSLKCRLTGDFASSSPSPLGAAFMEPSYAIRKSRLFCWRERTCGEGLKNENDDLPYIKRTDWETPN